MSPEIIIAVAVFLIVDNIALAILIFSKLREKSKRNKIAHYGDMAEEKVSEYLENNFPNSRVFNHILLKTDTGTTEIDHILVCRWGVYVIETKSHNGKIVISEKEWIQYYKDKIIKFHSPVLQNEIHIKAVEKILKKKRSTRDIKVHGLIVFTSSKVHFSGKPKGVIKLESLNMSVKHGTAVKRKYPITVRPGKKYLSQSKINEIASEIENQADMSIISRKKHIKAIGMINRNFNEANIK